MSLGQADNERPGALSELDLPDSSALPTSCAKDLDWQIAPPKAGSLLEHENSTTGPKTVDPPELWSGQTSPPPEQLHLFPNASDFFIHNLTVIQSNCPSIVHNFPCPSEDGSSSRYTPTSRGSSVCNICSRCGAIMTIVHRSQISTLRPSRSSSAELGRVWTEDGIPLHRDPLDLFHEERCEEIRQYKLLLYRYRTELAKVNDQIHALVEGAVVPLSCEPTLTRLFGSEEAQGIQHALRGYSLLKRGESINHLSRLRVRLAPHYSGLSEGTIKQLDEHLKVVITCVINDLKGEKEKHSLTFSTIRSRLMQLTVLEALPNTTALSKVIKCNNEHPFTAQVLLDSQWIIKLFESDELCGFYDLDTPWSSKHPKKWAKRFIVDAQTPTPSLSVGCDAHVGESETCRDRVTLVDITVLTFPCDDKPCFKVSHLKVESRIFQTKRLTSLNKSQAFLAIDYTSQSFRTRKAVLDRLDHGARNRAAALAESLFS